MLKTVEVSLPDFRNLGVVLRALVVVEGLAFLILLASEAGPAEALAVFIGAGVLREPVLLLVLAALYVLSPRLRRLPYPYGVAAVLTVAGVTGWLGHHAYGHWLALDLKTGDLHAGLVAALAAWGALVYFNWRHRVLSPALAEARLIALQARIRPHFLFNSLNTALGLLRDEPARAERVLENLAELYRALLSEAGALVPLEREVELARAYVEIEAMRLGERLRVTWQCDDDALDALVPPLILQPLLENAVYHGVQPAEAGGEVTVAIALDGDRLDLEVRNPCTATVPPRPGNRMALDNIRERLDLHFDAEAEMRAGPIDGEFVVRIRMPCRHG